MVEVDQSINLMEERFFKHAGITWRRDGSKVVPTSEPGEEVLRDFAAEEEEQAREAQDDPFQDETEHAATERHAMDPPPRYHTEDPY